MGGKSGEKAAQGHPVPIRNLNTEPLLRADIKPDKWPKGTRPDKTCFPASLSFLTSTAWGDSRHMAAPPADACPYEEHRNLMCCALDGPRRLKPGLEVGH